MPRYTAKTKELRAALLVKPLLANGLSEAALGRQLGISRQAVNQRLKNLPVGTALQQALEKVGITTSYKARKFKELLEAKKLQSINFQIKEVPDYKVQGAALHLVCQIHKDIDSQEGGGVKIINIIHAYREKKEPLDQQETQPQAAQLIDNARNP